MSALAHLSKKLQDEMRVVEVELVKGSAKDYAEYKAACGVHLGLMKANGLLVELAEQLEHADD